VDVDAGYETYLQRLEQASNLGEAYQIINEYLSGIGGGHSFFAPPGDRFRYDTGYCMAMVGDKCLIAGVRPGSDAEKKLHAGDQVLSVDGQILNRKNFWQVSYSVRVLAPAPGSDLELCDSEGVSRRERVAMRRMSLATGGLSGSKTGICGDCFASEVEYEQMQRLLRYRFQEDGDVIFWKMPRFLSDEAAPYAIIERARRYKALILDLRDNPGVPEDALTLLEQSDNPGFLPISLEIPRTFDVLRLMVGGLFDRDVRIGDEITRGKKKGIQAKPHGQGGFAGQLFVLVNSGTAAEAEVFARLVQSKHRGSIVGDLTPGNVTKVSCVNLRASVGILACIADAELTMADGTRLEGVGVTPDVLVLLTAADLAAGRDPVLARAAELAGAKLDPTTAGKMFPLEWPPF